MTSDDLESPDTAESGQPSGVSLRIDSMVIDGMPLAAGQVTQLRGAIQRELTRLLQRDGIGNTQGGALPGLLAPAIQVSAPFQPAELGRQIARSVHESLTKSL